MIFFCGLLERYGALSVFLYFLSFNLFVSSATFSPPGVSVPFINLQGFGLHHNIPSDCHARTKWPMVFICYAAPLSCSPCIVPLPAVCFSFSVMLVILRRWFQCPQSHSKAIQNCVFSSGWNSFWPEKENIGDFMLLNLFLRIYQGQVWKSSRLH